MSGIRLMAVVALVAIAACSDDSSGPEARVEGTYTLQTANGQNLPFTLFQDGGDRLELTGGTVTLNANGTFADIVTFKLVSGTTTVTDQAASTGTYTQSGSTLTFITSDNDTYTMTLSGSTLTQVVTDEDLTVTLVYRK